MKSIKFVGLFLLLPFFLFAQRTLTISGNITVNTQWNFDTVYLTGNLVIPNSITLSIAAGTKIVAKGYYKIDVKGCLLAIGEPSKFIYFTISDTTGFRDTSTTRGGWNGLHFESITTNNDSSILRYCQIQFGKSIGLTRRERIGGGILIDSCSKINIQNCKVVNNLATWGGAGIQVVNNASPRIIENLIKNNYSIGPAEGGGVASLENSAPTILKNIIIENSALTVNETPLYTSFYGEGAGIFVSSRTTTTPLIAFNLITNNVSTSGGGLYESSPNMKVFNNIIVNNFGGGVFHGHQRSSSIYANNTICNNDGQGFVSASTTINFSNNIVRNNLLSSSKDSFNVGAILQAWPQTRNNNIERMATQIRGNGNIDLPTLFERPTTVAGIAEKGYEADWRLKIGSPEIDVGTTANGLLDIIGNKDFLGKPRVVGATIDIGAIE